MNMLHPFFVGFLRPVVHPTSIQDTTGHPLAAWPAMCTSHPSLWDDPRSIWTRKHSLVGGRPTPLKNMNISWDNDIHNIYGKIEFMFQSPPTRNNKTPLFGYVSVYIH